MIARALLGVTALLLGGCASIMKSNDQKSAERNWDQHRGRVAEIGAFVLQARVSSGGMFGMKGNLRWQQHEDGRFDALISGPFGIGAVHIVGDETQVEVKTKKGTYKTSDPEKWIKDRMGWTFPIMGLRHWMLGIPSPHSEAHLELDLDGQAASIEQDGWKIDYTEYQQEGKTLLPRKLEVGNKEIRIKVAVDRWDSLAKVASR